MLRITVAAAIAVALTGASALAASPSAPAPSQTHNQAQSTHQAAGTTNGAISKASRHFVEDAWQGNQTEIDLGKLAESKGQSQDVRDFGQRLVSDHSQAQKDLKSVMLSAQVDVPTRLDKKHEKMVDAAKNFAAASFDHKFMAQAVKAHEQAVKLYEHHEKTAQDARVKSYIASTLPTLRAHLEAAQKTLKSLSATAKD